MRVEGGKMVKPTVRALDGSAFGAGVKRVSLSCAHGTTARLLLPGRAPLQETVLQDLLIAVHDSEKQCHCGETLHRSAAQA
jgi:hypothetical protein